MMHYGTITYVVQQILGYKDTGTTMGYSKEENDWCVKNEKEIWDYINKQGNLHATDPMIIRYYMKPAPIVTISGDKAPALIGSWVGGRIIASYMNKHKDMKIKDLLEMTDYQKILNESGYMTSNK